MDSFLYNKRLQTPIYTGAPVEIQKNQTKKQQEENSSEVSFRQLLEQKVQEECRITFSKHAMERVVQRNVDMSSSNIERLNEGVRKAEEKGLQDPLILIDSTAYLVNVKNNKVITVVNEESLKGSVFTNIDGTVMM